MGPGASGGEGRTAEFCADTTYRHPVALRKKVLYHDGEAGAQPRENVCHARSRRRENAVYRAKKIDTPDRKLFYRTLERLLESLLEGEPDAGANLANAAALLGHQMERINWAGFYLFREGELVLGPFWGKPACSRIPLGKGVCGTAAAERRTVLVPDVEAFPGHIACDGASASEIVVPLLTEGILRGVLDLDSPEKGRFDEEAS